MKKVEPCRPGHFFPVDVQSGAATPEPTTEQEPVSWVDNLPEKIRDVFLHIEEYSSITEAEVNTMLGNPRKTRRFALKFTEYVKKLPFDVEIETAASGKRWNKV